MIDNKCVRLVIEEDECEFCQSIQDDLADKAEEEHPEWRDERGNLYPEYKADYHAVHKNVPHRLCFVFVADCGGDSISICAEHLKDLHDKVQERS